MPRSQLFMANQGLLKNIRSFCFITLLKLSEFQRKEREVIYLYFRSDLFARSMFHLTNKETEHN